MHFVLVLVGAVLGLMSGADGGALIGGLLGFGAGSLWRLSNAVSVIETRLSRLEEAGTRPGTDSQPQLQAVAPVAPADVEHPTEPAPAPALVEAVQPPLQEPQPQPHQLPQFDNPPERSDSALGRRLEALKDTIVRFATTGNPVVRIGAVVLFIGVAYLLRYAYEHSLVPVELRLAGAALGGIALLAFGWRLRDRADTYGLILQSTGLAILYLTVFASARLYELVPLGAAFPILVVLVAGASVLSVMQRSQALAIFSMSGGFLAPVLTSTGEGSHVALFSYYALLNAGIVVMAWFQHWRWLNWTGFVFTFVIGSLWGFEYYRPEHYASTQPFLVLFFGFYVGVCVLFARNRAVELKGVIDGTLVFGTPVIAFALQAALVSDMSFGLAFSALVAAAVYAALAVWLKRQGHFSEVLDQSFVALAVVFATLAIPFAFDNQRFTAATWALEGAGIFWVGLRQAQRLPRAFGVMLQLAAGLAFAAEIGRPVGELLLLNSAFLGAGFLGVAGIYTAYLISSSRVELHRFEIPAGWVLLAWGVFWWLLGGLREFAWFTPGEERFVATNLGEHMYLAYIAGSVAVLSALARRLSWSEGLIPGLLLLPAAALILINLDIGWQQGTVLADLGWLAWPAMVAVFLWHLRQVDGLAALVPVWHAAGWWFLTLLITWNGVAVVDDLLGPNVWSQVLWGLGPLVACVWLLSLDGRSSWPFGGFPEAYFGWGWLAAYVYLLFWLLLTATAPGDPAPLPYLVVANPLELTQLAVVLLGVYRVRSMYRSGQGPEAAGQEWLRPAVGVVGAAAFVWINAVALRAVHFYGGIPYPVERIADSDAFQTTITILWTSIALLLMGFGARRALRVSWLVGAALLAVVIAKLFLVDMGQLDLVARIVSFITVGVLMLVIGYFAPIPPRRTEPASP
jgi:uncharacterized membrane protein